EPSPPDLQEVRLVRVRLLLGGVGLDDPFAKLGDGWLGERHRQRDSPEGQQESCSIGGVHWRAPRGVRARRCYRAAASPASVGPPTGPRSAGQRLTFNFGRAAVSVATPASVTGVSLRSRSCKSVRPWSGASPASVTLAFANASPPSFFNRPRWATPASV